MQLLMTIQRVGSSGQSVHNTVTAVMLITHAHQTLKIGKWKSGGCFPYLYQLHDLMVYILPNQLGKHIVLYALMV